MCSVPYVIKLQATIKITKQQRQQADGKCPFQDLQQCILTMSVSVTDESW